VGRRRAPGARLAALLSVPAHEALLRLRGADKDGDKDGDKDEAGGAVKSDRRDWLWRRLVRTNWVRTVCWSLRGAGAVELLHFVASTAATPVAL